MIQYRELPVYKYELERTYTHHFSRDLPADIDNGEGCNCIVSRSCDIYKTILVIHKGFKWDGASGPTFDTENSMRATLVHDALYRAIAKGHLPESCRAFADREFRRILKQDKMSWLRRWLWWAAVRKFGGSRAR